MGLGGGRPGDPKIRMDAAWRSNITGSTNSTKSRAARGAVWLENVQPFGALIAAFSNPNRPDSPLKQPRQALSHFFPSNLWGQVTP